MGEKSFLLEMGDRTVAPVATDELLRSKISDRRRKEITRQEEIDEAEHKTRMAKLKKDETSAEAAVEKSGEKREETGGLKVTGGVDFGKIDFQEERKEAKADAEKLRKEMADTTTRTAQENSQLRNDLHAAEMREIRATNESALALMKDRIDGRSPVEIITDIRTTAAELGLKPPDPGASDPALQLQLLHLQNEEAARQREHEWDKMKHAEEMEERREQRKETSAVAMANIAQQQKRDEMIPQGLQVIGTMIAKGIRESEPGSGITEETPKGSRQYQATVPVGGSGEMDCPNCNSVVGIGPTADMAVCANCDSRISIKRVGAGAPAAGK